jgi:hypothetical protein
MIPTLKKMIACDSISRLFLVLWLRQLGTTMISGPAAQCTVHISRSMEIQANRKQVSVISKLLIKDVGLSGLNFLKPDVS